MINYFCPQMMVTGAKAGKEWKGRSKEEEEKNEESEDTGGSIIL